jgi:Spy/CpxP family protein refolding chaperone
MSNRDTYNASVAAATLTKAAAVASADAASHSTIDAAGVNAGLVLQNGNAAYVTATQAAAKAKLDAIYKAEQARQASFDAARETLRGTGDLGPL